MFLFFIIIGGLVSVLLSGDPVIIGIFAGSVVFQLLQQLIFPRPMSEPGLTLAVFIFREQKRAEGKPRHTTMESDLESVRFANKIYLWFNLIFFLASICGFFGSIIWAWTTFLPK